MKNKRISINATRNLNTIYKIISKKYKDLIKIKNPFFSAVKLPQGGVAFSHFYDDKNKDPEIWLFIALFKILKHGDKELIAAITAAFKSNLEHINELEKEKNENN